MLRGNRPFLIARPPSTASGISTLPCAATSIIPSEDNIFRARSELFIYVDVSWPFAEIQPVLAHLLNNLDVSRFGTVYTILNAMDGTVIVPRTQSLADMYSTWNLTSHQDRESSILSILAPFTNTFSLSIWQIPRDSVCVMSWTTFTCAARS